MKIILSGGGDPETVVPIDEYFAAAIDRQKPVLYIPIAMEGRFSYDECFGWFTRTYAPFGIRQATLCTDLAALRLDARYAAVFIGGGNTFKLLQAIQQSDFAAQLRAYLAAGGVLYGGSAGAIICGKTIAPAACLDENLVGLQNLAALDLLGGYDVFCHYAPGEYDAFINTLSRKLYLLHEESGLVFDGEKIQSVGRPFLTQTA